ncbi:FAD-dependent thymidylate synthase [Acidiferrimicrobium sp. IK]|uniref:FAD-dependent thymidylate synthase n=1 Tax=Acidiferrimicrobium sp. IK TaxID=2871700 RepID=UPI0021CB11B5|nr:FAD-dependent thymidylate synthase [Acidiferrimicrobium sp. IK]MCU4184675.1 FAD-dependent thymidylate synthase [Acidiferrimicrobium sp. IK]
MELYATEEWTDDEAEILRRYFTNLDGPVFALVNLPEVVKGALFARYSRTAKSLRRLFLDEFVGDLDISGDHSVDATVGLARAEELYERVFFEYGDDSVAQLGGVHLACEQASNLLTKVLEWGRLMAYMEKSTRYVAYDARLPNGRYRYYRDPAILDSPLGARYVGDMDRLFDAYAELLPVLGAWFSAEHPKQAGDSDFVWRQSIRAKAFDALRGMLPAAATSNLGIYASGQAYEALLLRMRAHPLPEARAYAELMLVELRKVIPSWVRRVDVPDRGGAWVEYMEKNHAVMQDLADALFATPDDHTTSAATEGGDPEVTLVDWDPDAETKTLTAMLYPFTHLPEAVVAERVARMGAEERLEVVRRYAGDRSNRRHRPGRALERSMYRFDVVSDYGAFRDLQRHRMLTIEWQSLSPAHGYTLPGSVIAAGAADAYHAAMERSAALYDVIGERFGPQRAGYGVALAYRVRYSMQLNAREAMHMLELRTTAQGHPEYRKVGQQMHRLIAEKAGHRALAELMTFVDHADYEHEGLERLAGERRAEQRRLRVQPPPSG